MAMNLKSVEGWYVIFQTLSVIFVLLTVGTGVGTIITGYIVNRRQTKNIAILQKEAADARRRQAEAETQLLLVRKKLEPRLIRADIFKDALRGTEPRSVEILYPKDNGEAFLVAGQLALALSRVPGWIVSNPKPIPELPEQALPPILDAGSQPLGITIRTSNLEGAAKALRRALNQEDFEAATVLDHKLPEKVLRVIIAPRL
jgi:hypothetical protein